MHYRYKYTPEPKAQGYPESVRKRAIEMYVDGGNLRRIARQKVSPKTVAYWVMDVAEALPHAPLPNEVRETECDINPIPGKLHLADPQVWSKLTNFLLGYESVESSFAERTGR